MVEKRRRVGLLASVKEMATIALTSVRTRLELFGNELEEEKLRLIHQAVLALSMVFCLCAGALLAVFFIVVLFWEQRVAVLGVSTAFFLGLGTVLFLLFRKSARREQPMFAATLGELREDVRQLKSAASHESRPD